MGKGICMKALKEQQLSTFKRKVSKSAMFIVQGFVRIILLLGIPCLLSCTEPYRSKPKSEFSAHTFIYSFENGWNSKHGRGSLKNRDPKADPWRYSDMQSDIAGMVVTDPVRRNNGVMRFVWENGKGQSYNSNTRKKAHLYGYLSKSSRSKEAATFEIFFPSKGQENDSEEEIIIQWHAEPDKGESFRNPPVTLSVKNGVAFFSWIYDTRKITPRGFREWDRKSIALGAIPKDRWLTFDVYIQFDPWGQGQIEAWIDERKVIDEKGIAVGFNDEKGIYLGIGFYKYTNKSDHQKRVIYFDNIAYWKDDSLDESPLKKWRERK